MIEFTIYGQLYSMKNSRMKTRSGAWIKHPKAIQFEKDFMSQLLGNHWECIEAPCAVWIDVWYPSMRQDLSCDLIYDLCQHAGLVRNDRLFREKHERAFIDKKAPRVHIKIGEL